MRLAHRLSERERPPAVLRRSGFRLKIETRDFRGVARFPEPGNSLVSNVCSGPTAVVTRYAMLAGVRILDDNTWDFQK